MCIKKITSNGGGDSDWSLIAFAKTTIKRLTHSTLLPEPFSGITGLVTYPALSYPVIAMAKG